MGNEIDIIENIDEVEQDNQEYFISQQDHANPLDNSQSDS